MLKYPKSRPNECLQVEQTADGTFQTVGHEDCLTLDVYTHRIGYNQPTQVVVVIAVPTLAGGWPDASFKGLSIHFISTEFPLID